MRARQISVAWLVFALACGTTAPAEAPPPAPVAAAPSSPGEVSSVSDAELEGRVIAISDDGAVLPLALGRLDDELTLIASTPSGLSRWALDLEASRAVVRAELAPPEEARGALVTFREGRAWWVTPAEHQTVWAERTHPSEPSQRTLMLAYHVARDDGLRAELRICPPETSRRLGTKAQLCDHRIATIAAVAGGLLVGGSLTREGTSVPWLGLIDERGAHRTSVALEGYRGAVTAIIPGEASVLVVGYERFGTSAQGWWVVLDDTEDARPLASGLLPSRMAETPWLAGAARPGGGHWLLFPHTSFDLRLVTISEEIDTGIAEIDTGTAKGIERSLGIADVTVPSSSRQALVAVDGRPWLVIAETGHGGRAQRLSLLAIDDQTGRVVARHHGSLTPGSFAHAIHYDAGSLLLAGRIGTERTEVVAFEWPLARP